jgi:DNA polymerase-3 subunit delta
MVATADAFFAALTKDPLPPVMAMGGAERVYVDDALATIRSAALLGGMADFNHDRISARERTFNQIASTCRTLPVMARRRLVEVKDASHIKEPDFDQLVAYLLRPCPETVLVLLFDDIDLRDKLVKLVDKHALLCRFEHPKEREMPVHVQRRARRCALKLDSAATTALAATVGADLTLLERALEKLALVATPDGVVTAEQVEKHIADTHLQDAFAFARAVAKQARGPALAAVGALQAAREEPLRIIGLLAWQLRLVARARALADDGRSSSDIGAELSLYGDRLSLTLDLCKKGDMRAHADRLAFLSRADQLLKGSRQPPWLIMTRLVLDLCPPPAPSSGGGGKPAR